MNDPMNAKFITKFLGTAATAAILTAATPALAGTCDAAGAKAIGVGMLEPVAAGTAAKYSVDLSAGQGVLIDLVSVAPAAPSDSEGEDGEGHPAAQAAGTLRVCDASGVLVAPLASDVFANGGTMSATEDGARLRFIAPAAGRFVIASPAAEGARELLLRGRDLPAASRTVTELELGGSDFAKVSSAAPLVYSFQAKAGQWVKLTATSENDTVLHLAAPNGEAYEVIADNDDSDGTNPMIKRRLPATGTYYVQVESLTSDVGEVTVLVQPTTAPPPPPAPTALRLGPVVEAKLESSEDKRVYALPVQAGHGYRLELTAPYDAVIEVGLEDPLMSEEGADGNGFSSIKSQDGNLTGTEKLTFTARASGRVLVQVRAFGLGDGDGSYKLVAVDTGM